MLANRTLSIDGKTYDRFTVGMAITGSYKPDGRMQVDAAIRLTPTRIEDETGEVQQNANATIPFPLLDVENCGDTADKAAFAAIQTAMETWLQAKGL